MEGRNKVVINTIILYLKIIISLSISFISVPLVLNALGEKDFGLYNLIFGIVSMLAFLNSSMSMSTQRFLSVTIGTNDLSKCCVIYNTSIVLHIIIGITVAVLLEICSFFIFDGFLNIDTNRLFIAKCIYHLLVISTLFSILSVPYVALMNAKEDMLAFSIINIIDVLAKLALAIYLSFCPYDRLFVYALILSLLSIINTMISRIYVSIKYKEFKRNLSLYFNFHSFKALGRFAGWNTINSFAVVGRNQGIAVVFNNFFGTIANAAYGIANQISGVLLYFSGTFQKSMNPQLMQSEGRNERMRMNRISFMLTKYSALVLSSMGIPLIIETPYVLELWLQNVPKYTTELVQLVLILYILYQFSIGTMSVIQAVGDIKIYSIITSMLFIITIPVSYFLLKAGFPLYSSIIVFIIFEFISFVFRLIYAHKKADLNIIRYLCDACLPVLVCIVCSLLVGIIPHLIMDQGFLRLFAVCFVYISVTLFIAWNYVLDNDIKILCFSLITRLIHKVTN